MRQSHTFAALAAHRQDVGQHELASQIDLQEVTPLSLGVGNDKTGFGGCNNKEKYSYHCQIYAETYYTWETYQTEALFRNYEEELVKIEDNNLLDEFRLHDIPSRPQGEDKNVI